MKILAGAMSLLSFCVGLSTAQEQKTSAAATLGSWTPLTNQPTAIHARLSLLLTDGRILVQDNTPFPTSTGVTWQVFSPDSTGSYINGTWGATSTLPVIGGTQYSPLYFASAVLADGRVVIMGGEYNQSNGGTFVQMGAFYRPYFNEWLPLTPPTNGAGRGDAASVVLPDGTWMVQDPETKDSAILDPNHQCLDNTANYWTNIDGATAGKADINDEEGWTLLRDGTVLTVDVKNAPNSERFFPGSRTWVSAGKTGVLLVDPYNQEIGPAVMRPDYSIFATGDCPVGEGPPTYCNDGTTGMTSVFSPDPQTSAGGIWNPGPKFPGSGKTGLDIADGPAAVLPNGNVLLFASPGNGEFGAQFLIFDGAHIVSAPNIPNAPDDASVFGSMLVLPTGQIWFTDGSQDVEIFTPAGTYESAWQPTITKLYDNTGASTSTLSICVPSANTTGVTYGLQGTQFNGRSQGAAYGDDEQMATNYPLVRITNTASGTVVYCKTHTHSTMGVGTDYPVSTLFDVGGAAPGACTPDTSGGGASTLEVVANGIPSAPLNITVVQGATGCPAVQCGQCTCPNGASRTLAEDAALSRF